MEIEETELDREYDLGREAVRERGTSRTTLNHSVVLNNR